MLGCFIIFCFLLAIVLLALFFKNKYNKSKHSLNSLNFMIMFMFLGLLVIFICMTLSFMN